MKHILLVDDDVAVRNCIRQFLEIQGYDCTEADNGAIALEKLGTTSFSLIITDNQMPVMDGISFLEAYHNGNETTPVPIIIVTGRLTPSLKARAQRIGVRTIFEKPCTFEALSEAISNVI